MAMPCERANHTAAGRVPDLGGVIQTTGDNPLTVPGKNHGIDLIGVSFKSEQFLVIRDLPDFGRLIPTAG